MIVVAVALKCSMSVCLCLSSMRYNNNEIRRANKWGGDIVRQIAIECEQVVANCNPGCLPDALLSCWRQKMQWLLSNFCRKHFEQMEAARHYYCLQGDGSLNGDGGAIQAAAAAASGVSCRSGAQAAQTVCLVATTIARLTRSAVWQRCCNCRLACTASCSTCACVPLAAPSRGKILAGAAAAAATNTGGCRLLLAAIRSPQANAPRTPFSSPQTSS